MRLVILDRDGVINKDSDDFIKSPDEFVLIDGSLEAIARLNHAGFKVAIATNQSGIARGLFNLDALHAMHEKLRIALAAVNGKVDAIYYCPHGPDEACACRKPKPGLLLKISDHFKIPLDNVPVIGDSLRDLNAAQAVAARPILVRTGKGIRTISNGKGLDGIAIYNDLSAAVDALVNEVAET